MTKKILILGSKGFIGSHIRTSIEKQSSFECFCCDIVPDTTHDAAYFCIENPENPDYAAVFSQTPFDVCINCSGAASVPDSLINPLRDFTLNTLNITKLLESIRTKAPHCVFINLSSAAVYGNPTNLPIAENAPVTPVSPYGWHKHFAEQICREYREIFGIKTISLRIFSAYGTGLKKQIFWDLTKKAFTDETIHVFGTGHETRDFIHIDDICNAIQLVLHNLESIPPVLNVANGIQYSTKTIVETICASLNCRKPVIFSKHNRTGDPLYWEADISFLKALGYKQTISLEQGTERYTSWVKELLQTQ